MAKLIIKNNGELEGRIIELKPGVNRFGRESTNDFSFPFPEVSGAHCEVLVDNEFVFVRDLNSSNGTFIDGDMVRESALYSGQALKIGCIEMILEAPQIQISLPELPKPEPVGVPKIAPLGDGYSACLAHPRRHAIWECLHCTRCYCDECIRKLRRVGGVHLRLCPSCSHPTQFTPWAEMMRKKKKGFFGSIVSTVSKLTEGFKRSTTRLIQRPPDHMQPPPPSQPQP